MALSLAKNQTISLEKTAGTSLTRVKLGLGWDPAKPASSGGLLSRIFAQKAAEDIDLDASCLIFDASRTLLDTVWFRQLKSRDGSVRHSGDNLTGEGDGDDESIYVDLDRLPSQATHLVFTVNSFRGQTFDEVDNAFCRVVNEANGQEIGRFSLSDKGQHTGVVMGVLSRQGGDWTFRAVGTAMGGRMAGDMGQQAAAAIA